MRRVTLFIGVLLTIAIVALPAMAGSRRFAEDALDYWIEEAEYDGYEVFYTDVDTIDADHSISYYLDLEPGTYYFYAEGGDSIEDLDMYVYSENGRELDSDTLGDSYPYCTIELSRGQEIEVELVVYEFYSREREDYYCFVAAQERLVTDVGDIIDYWVDWADDSGYDVIETTSGRVSDDESAYFYYALDNGKYYIYAESAHDNDDIDLYVYDEDEYEIDSDTLGDNYPICTFELSQPEDVEIEVCPYEFGSGQSTAFGLVIAIEGEGGIIGEEIVDRPDRPISGGRVTDDEDWEYIHEVLADYMDMVIDENLDMIFDEIELVDEGSTRTFRITLGRGDYIAYAEGGLRIEDLDLHIYDDDGRIVSEDTMIDNFPVAHFSCRRSTTFEIEVGAYAMESGAGEGYFVLVVVRE